MRVVTFHVFKIVVIGVNNTSAIADHVKATGHTNFKWDHFDVLATGKTDYHYKIKETLFIQEFEPAFNVNVGSHWKADALLIVSVIITIIYFTVTYLLNLDSSPLIRFAIYK